MVVNKSQTELEAPAKVYQLDAVDKKVDEVTVIVKQILDQTKGVATHADLVTLKREILDEVKNDIEDEVKKIHLEYSPTKKAALWVLGSVILALVANAVLFIFYRGG